MRIISITNQKGGCGKTTTAVNLAASLALNNRRVLLIDLDPQSHATLGLNIKAYMNMYNVLSKITNKKAKIEEIIQKVDEGFDIAPSSIVLSTLEQELAGEIGRESRLCDILKDFNHKYDYIIIDCPPNLGILTVNAIRSSSEIIIPVEASRFAFEGLNQLITIVNLIRDRLSHVVKFQILITNFDSRLRHSFKMLDQIKNTYKGRLFSTIIHINVKLKEAQSNGTHVASFDKYCRGTKDYFSLSREIVTQEKKIPQVTVKGTTTAVATVKVPETSASKISALEKKMNQMIKEELPKMSDVTFSVYAPDAEKVFLAGNFNNWKLDDQSLMERKNGTWSKRVKLFSGRYHYRFVVDGSWLEDPKNPQKEVNPFGQMNSLLEIGAK